SEIETSLKSLGVDTAATPRKDASGNDLPDTFSPLGAQRDLTKFDELLIGGLNISGSSKRVNFLERKPATPAVDATEDSPAIPAKPASSKILHTPSVTQWIASSLREAVAADVDGDGMEEAVVVYKTDANKLMLLVVDDEPAEFAVLHE